MNILVTGGAGFIGSHLTCELLKRGHKVSVVDILCNFAGRDFSENISYRKGLIKGAEFIRGKSSSRSFWKKKFEVVVHLAGIPVISPKKGDFYTYNIQETDKVLRIARDTGVRRLVFISSIYAYGHYRGSPYREDMSLEPHDQYGISKAVGEYLTRYYFCDREWGIIRTAGVYGFGDHNPRIARLVIELHSQLSQMFITRGVARNFIYIDDLIDGMVRVIESPVLNNAFNLVTETVTLEEFIERVKKYVPTLAFKFRVAPKDELFIGPVDINKAKKLLGFNPKFSLDKGMQEYIKKIKEFSRIDKKGG